MGAEQGIVRTLVHFVTGSAPLAKLTSKGAGASLSLSSSAASTKVHSEDARREGPRDVLT